MVSIRTRSGGMSVRRSELRPTDVIIRGGGGGGGMSTQSTPTPSASELYGTATQRQQQIDLFRKSGKAAMQSRIAEIKAQERREQQQKERERREKLEKERATAERKKLVKRVAVEKKMAQARVPNRSTIISQAPSMPSDAFIPTRTVERAKIGKLEEVRAKSRTQRERGESTIGSEAKSFAAGVGTSFVQTGKFAKQLVISPVETIGRSIESIPKIPKGLATIGAMIEDEPSFAAGYITGEIAQLKGAGAVKKGVVKGVDISRTARLKELPAKQVIAPEYPRQTFPKIKKGQTAGELLEEFKVASFPESKEVVRVSPEKHLKSQVKEGKLYAGKTDFEKVAGWKGVRGAYIPKEIAPRLFNERKIGKILKKKPKDVIAIQKGMKGFEKQKVIAHELIHAKTPKVILTSPLEKLPYRARPSEVIAYGLDKAMAKKGFKTEVIIPSKPAGFTAAPKPIKELITREGSSEFAGLYQAPKVSPHFLRISGEEKKLFSFGLGETLRPTVFRIAPKEFKLVPQIKSSTKQIQPQKIKEIRKYIETAPKGKSYVPFIKTEKEAVIPVGTELVQKPTKYYFKFEGRRIPITEFETKSSTLSKTTKLKSETPRITTSDISKQYGSSRIGKRGKITSSEAFVGSSSISKSYTKSMTSPLTPSISSSIVMSKRKSSVKSKPSKAKGKPSKTPIPSIPSYAYTKYIKTPSPTSTITAPPSIPPKVTKPSSKKKDSSAILLRKKKRKGKTQGREDLGIAEGFIARTLGLKATKIPKSKIPKIARRSSAPLGLRRKPIIK